MSSIVQQQERLLPARRAQLERQHRVATQQQQRGTLQQLSIEGSKAGYVNQTMLTLNISKRPAGKPRPRSCNIRPRAFAKPMYQPLSARSEYPGPEFEPGNVPPATARDNTKPRNDFTGYCQQLQTKRLVANVKTKRRPQSASLGTGKHPTAMGIANRVAERTFLSKAKLTTPRELEAKHVHRNLSVEKFLDTCSRDVREQHKEYVPMHIKKASLSPSPESELSKVSIKSVTSDDREELHTPLATTTRQKDHPLDIEYEIPDTKLAFEEEANPSLVEKLSVDSMKDPVLLLSDSSSEDSLDVEGYHKCIVSGVFSETSILDASSTTKMAPPSPFTAWGKADGVDLLGRRRNVVSIDHEVFFEGYGKKIREVSTGYNKSSHNAKKKKKSRSNSRNKMKVKLLPVPEETQGLAPTSIDLQAPPVAKRSALQNVQNLTAMRIMSPAAKPVGVLLGLGANTPMR